LQLSEQTEESLGSFGKIISLGGNPENLYCLKRTRMSARRLREEDVPLEKGLPRKHL